MINHLEVAYPTIATDYTLAIFGDDMAEYLDVFLAAEKPRPAACCAPGWDSEGVVDVYASLFRKGPNYGSGPNLVKVSAVVIAGR